VRSHQAARIAQAPKRALSLQEETQFRTRAKSLDNDDELESDVLTELSPILPRSSIKGGYTSMIQAPKPIDPPEKSEGIFAPLASIESYFLESIGLSTTTPAKRKQ